MADDRRKKQVPPNALVASAAIVDPTKITRLKGLEDWQTEAWHYFDTVPEVSFGVGWLQNAMSRCRLVAANRGEGGDEPAVIVEPEDEADGDPAPALPAADQAAFDLMRAFAGGTTGQSQILGMSTVHLTVPGDGYILGQPTGDPEGTPGPEAWSVYSADEIRVEQARYSIKSGDSTTDWTPTAEDTLAVRMWRRHPRYHYKANSPLRATLTVLRELELLTQHIEASGVSRLAGNGLLVLPEEITFPISDANKAQNKTEFIHALMEAMITPIGDRTSAAAVVPLVVQVKGEWIDKIQRITFDSPLDEHSLGLREEAIKRFAAGMDLPAEVVLGLADSNHWTAWQIEESALKLHVEPMLEAICDGLTLGYLRPALEALGLSPTEVANYVVWYDTSELTVRPDRSGDAREAYRDGVVGASTYRREIGMGDEDAPTDEETKRKVILDVIAGLPSAAPALLKALGIDVEIPTDVEPIPGAPVAPAPPAPDDETPAAPGPPEPSDEAALLAAADGLVFRALEKAGNRLANAARASGCKSLSSTGALTHTSIPEEVRLEAVDAALEGVWDRVPEIAANYDMEPHALAATLDGYTRGLILSGWPHSMATLAEHLGA